ncbi:MAG: phosphoserine phosphatase SerB [Burkholderiaceae bacterium]
MSTLIVQHPCLSRIAVDAFTALAGHPPDLSTDRLALWRRVSIEGETLEAAAQVHQVDAEIVAPDLRLDSFGLAAFDMDSTLITIECVDEIADFAGRKAEVAAITEAAMRGEISDYDESLRRRVALLEGLPESVLQRVWDERVELSPGAETLVRRMKASGLQLLLVSGGFSFFTDRLAARLGIAHVHSNRLEVSRGKLTGHLVGPVINATAKRVALERTAARIGCPLARTIAVGDGANDLQMMSVAGLSVAYRAKPLVRNETTHAINHGGLDSLLGLFEDTR